MRERLGSELTKRSVCARVEEEAGGQLTVPSGPAKGGRRAAAHVLATDRLHDIRRRRAKELGDERELVDVCLDKVAGGGIARAVS